MVETIALEVGVVVEVFTTAGIDEVVVTSAAGAADEEIGLRTG